MVLINTNAIKLIELQFVIPQSLSLSLSLVTSHEKHTQMTEQKESLFN